MYSNGNFSTFDPTSSLWTSFNNKGMRRIRRETDNVTYDIEAVPCSYETCAITHSRVMFRDDGVISIQYTDGRVYTVHKDGTKMFTTSDQSEIVIEREDFACVRVKLGVRMNENDPAFSEQDVEKIVYETYLSQMAYDQILTQTICFDGTLINSF